MVGGQAGAGLADAGRPREDACRGTEGQGPGRREGRPAAALGNSGSTGRGTALRMPPPLSEPKTLPFEDACSREQLGPEDELKRQFKELTVFQSVTLVEVPATANQFQVLR